MSEQPTLVDLLLDRAAAMPDTVAARMLRGDTPGDAWTWGELAERSRAVAAHLQTCTKAGDRVLLLFPQGLDYLAALYGSMMAGVLAVPLQPPGTHRAAHALPKLEAIANDGGIARALTIKDQLEDMVMIVSQSAALANLPWTAVDDLPGSVEALSAAWTHPGVGPDDLAYLQYTSGSTSTPKGVMVSHGNLSTNLTDFDLHYGHDEDSVMVSWLPTFHDLGLVYGVFLPLWKGIPTVLLDPLDFLRRPLRWPAAISTYRGTHSPSPNFAFDLAVSKSTAEERAALDLSCWKVALNGAEPIRQDTEARFVAAFAASGMRWRTVSHAYGMSETTAVIAKEPVGTMPRFFTVDANALEQHKVVLVDEDHPHARMLAGCGETVRGTVVRIVDGETLATCAQGQVGEIWVGGPSRAQGYWNKPEDTKTGFFAHTSDTGEGPFLRTGDLGFVWDDQVVVTGRLKDMIIVRGENHYPQDLEWSAQQSHAAVRPSCVAAFGMAELGREAVGLVMEVYPKVLAEEGEDAVFGAVRQAIAEHGLQLSVIALWPPRSIFKTSSGKIMRRRTRAALSDGSVEPLAVWRLNTVPVDAVTAPSTEDLAAALAAAEDDEAREDLLLDAITAVAAELLGLPDPDAIEPDVPLRELGFDSVQAVELAERLGNAIGHELPTTVLFDHPTAEALAEHVAGTLAAQPAAAATPAAAPAAGDDLEALLAAELADLD